jgi:hypothetical protein
MDGGGSIKDEGVGDDGRTKKKRLEWGSTSNPTQRSSVALKERPPPNTNVNVLPEMAQKGGGIVKQKIHAKPTPCNFDGCTDDSIKDGLCKTHWCAVNLCSYDGCIKLALSKGLCREHTILPTRVHSTMRKHDHVEKVDAEISTKDKVRDTGKFFQVKGEAMTMEVTENEKQKQNGCGLKKQSFQRKTCAAEGCPNQSVVKGVCFRHGAKRKLCDTDGCTNLSIRRGVCFRHGAKRKLCKAEGCTKLTQRNGVCSRHGSFVVDAEESVVLEEEANEPNDGGPELCVEIPPSLEASSDLSKSSSVESDDTYEVQDRPVAALRSLSVSSAETVSSFPTEANSSSSSSSYEECTCGLVKGVRCVKHKRRRKPCSFEDCTNRAVIGGICIKHGAKVKRCSHDGCENVVQKRGLCRKHGAFTCSFAGCYNSEVEGGLCLQHNAREKQEGKQEAMCSHLLCTSAAVDGVVCIRHEAPSSIDDPPPPPSISPTTTLTKSGRKVKPCKSEGCTNRAIQGGQCFRHGAKAHRKLCSSKGCQNYVVRGGICIKHGANQVSMKSPTEEEDETKNESPVKSLKQEDENSSLTDAGDKKVKEELFKSIDQLEDNCADILLLLRNEG